MTAYDVDLDELRGAVRELAACQRDLLGLAGEIDSAQDRMRGDWSGVASDAQAASYGSWRDGCADMVRALAALRGLADAADGHYSLAAATNLELWRRVAP